jgi:DNA-binding NarL/FixJ family response regulator
MLSPTLRKVAEFAAAGATGPEIAAALRIRPDSARAYVAEVYRRLDVGNRVELAGTLASRECALRAET